MTELEILQGLKTREIAAFKALIMDYSEDITVLAYVLTKDRDMAQMIVDNLLIDIWNKVIVIPHIPIHPFLRNQIREACGFKGLNYSSKDL